MIRWQFLTILSVSTLVVTKDLSAALTPDSTKINNRVNTSNANAQYLVANNSDNSEQQDAQKSLLHQLNLSWLQKQRIQKIHRQYQQQILQQKNRLKSLQNQLTEMMAGTDSVESIRAKNRELVLLRQKVGELHFESMLATREVLTPEQRQKFREIVETRQNK